MAMIECPQCSSQISDKATKCPQCGVELTPVVPQEHDEKLTCQECGEELPADVDACPKCGCPVEVPAPEAAQKVDVSNVSIQVSQGARKKVGIIIAAIVIALIAGIVAKVAMDSAAEQQAKQAAQTYSATLSSAASTMLTGAASAEKACGMIHDVWYNTIYKKSDDSTDEYTKSGYSYNDDFNESLAKYMSSSEYLALKTIIESSQESAQYSMKDLKDPPDEYSDAYDAIKELYDAFNEITNMAINPNGSLQSFTSTFNAVDSNFSNKYDAMKLYLE